MPVLIVFGGLPGTGKTTLARAIAIDRAATYLRIDTIEQALQASGMLAGDVGPAGYLAAYSLAESNLLLGHAVVAEGCRATLRKLGQAANRRRYGRPHDFGRTR